MRTVVHVEDCFYKRWLPIGFDRRARSIRWMDFGNEELSGFMLDHHISQYRQSAPAPPEWTTDLRTLIATAGHLNRVVPSGVIFHVSRCGSTLLSNVLRTDPNVALMSEPSIINMLLQRPEKNVFNLFRRNRKNDARGDRRRLVESVTTLYSHRMLARRAGALMIKFNDIGIVHLREIMKWWPDMRVVVLIRNPVEVIASNMANPTGFLRSTEEQPATTGRVFGWTESRLYKMSKEERCARVIGRIQEIALACLGPKCRVVDYSDLSVARIREVATFLGAHLPDARCSAISDAMAVYSKDSTRSTAFVNDTADKRRNAPETAKRAAERWAGQTYRALLAEARSDWNENLASVG